VAPDPLYTSVLHAALDSSDVAAAHWHKIGPPSPLDGTVDPEIQLLLPLVWSNLMRVAVNSADMPLLKGLYRRVWYQNQVQLPRYGAAIRVLGEAGVEAGLIGGAALACVPWGYAGDLGIRTLDDTSILVLPDRWEAALEVLVAAGWRSPPQSRMRRRMAARRRVMLSSPDGEILRLTWSPSSRLEAASQPMAPWWQADHRLDLGPVEARTLSPTDTLLITCVDGPLARHGLQWIVDAHKILTTSATELDFDRCLAIADRSGVSEVLMAALEYLSTEFSLPLPASVAPQGARRRRGG
jgi:hypothetical protein